MPGVGDAGEDRGDLEGNERAWWIFQGREAGHGCRQVPTGVTEEAEREDEETGDNLLEMFIQSFIFRHSLIFPYLVQTHWKLFFLKSNDDKCIMEN